MKKYVLILLFIMLSCSSMNTYLLDKKYYSSDQTELLKKEVYRKIKLHQADSVPFKYWLIRGYSTPEENGTERIYSFITDNKNEKVFVITTHENKDSIFYSFEIYFRQKSK